MSIKKLVSSLAAALCLSAVAGVVSAADEKAAGTNGSTRGTLKGGSSYEKNLEQAGMSGMSGFTGMSGMEAKAPATPAKAKTKAKRKKAKKPAAAQ